MGPEYPVYEIVRYIEPGYTCTSGAVTGFITGIMRTFGNLETSIPISAAERTDIITGDEVRVNISSGSETLYERVIPYRASFGWVQEGEDVLYNSSDGVLGIGINLGNFAQKYGIDPEELPEITVRKE